MKCLLFVAFLLAHRSLACQASTLNIGSQLNVIFVVHSKTVW